MEETLQKPIYFVLGNHDFYGASISKVRSVVSRLTGMARWLHWLTESGVVEISPDCALIGHDGWADGRLGDGVNSTLMLNDYFYIQEFIGLSAQERFGKLNSLGDEAAAYFQRTLPEALRDRQRVILLTHVPPFREACWHEGKISDDNRLPHFASAVVGEVLVEVMIDHPTRHLTVLCGHTHGHGEVSILPNLIVKTGGAEYGKPRIQEVITVA